MQIVPLDDGSRAEYEAFVRRQPAGLLYYSAAFQDFLCKSVNAQRQTAIARDGSGVRGVLPLLSLDGPWGRVYNSLPFFGSHGGILAESEGARRALLDWYNMIAHHVDTASSTMIANPFEESSIRDAAHNHIDYRIGQLTSLDVAAPHGEAMLGRFHYKTRNMIRKAEKSGIKVRIENDELGFLREVHEENLAALGGLAKPKAFFEELPRCFSAGSDYCIYVARLDGQPVAALLVFHYGVTSEYYTPVIREAYRELQPMSLLIFTAMTEAAIAGQRWWNWGGTWPSQEGVYRFKKRWGTEDRKYLYHVQLNRPEILRETPAAVSAAYPFFYVLPFSLLRPAAV